MPATPGPRYEKGGIALFVEAPREAEDAVGRQLEPGYRYGRPNAGVLVGQMLQMAGLDRDETLVLSRVRCRPVRDRLDDSPEALANCEPWNVEEFALYDPAVVVCMGNNAMRPIFGAKALVTHIRGTARTTGPNHEWGHRTWLATFHPYSVSRTPALMVDVAADLQAAVELWKESR